MKTIVTEIYQKGCEKITDSYIKIIIDDTEVENNTLKIIEKALEIKHPLKIYRIDTNDNCINVYLIAKNGRLKVFEKKNLPMRCEVEYWDKNSIKKYFEEIVDFLKEIERWIKENSKCMCKYTLEFS